MDILRTRDLEPWREVLSHMQRYDFYHTPAYHRLAEKQGDGTAYLFVHKEGVYRIALPLLLRPVSDTPGLEESGAGWQDATSVYGYGGPLCSHPRLPPPVIQNFQRGLEQALRKMRVVTAFSRLHPLLFQYDLLSGLGECVPCGETVSIDLTLPIAVQSGKFRDNHVREINKSRRLGRCSIEDRHFETLPQFIEVYTETMRRVNASDYYFFDRAYFEELIANPDLGAHLFVILVDGEMACGGLFIACGGILQYHLAGTANKYLKGAPIKLLFDDVRLWAAAQGLEVFHLGGGVGAQADSLFRFKAGFSDRRHEFRTWRWIILPPVFEALCERKNLHNRCSLSLAASPDYFPPYRCDTVSHEPEDYSAMNRIFLSPPHMGCDELKLVQETFASNWIAPMGPNVEAFEKEFSAMVGIPHAAALSSGTAALHLALRLLEVGPGDEVICSSLTFSASANPILYERARPVFIDSEKNSWNMDPGLLSEELRQSAARGRLPKAVIVVDIYGQSADYDPILQACAEYGVPVIEDAAEALGATYKGTATGNFGKFGAFSFNGNKIITTSGGGMLVCRDPEKIGRARFLASQARDAAPHYQHSSLGYNYRMSNVLAAIGRGQLRVLRDRIAARRRNNELYKALLQDLPGLAFMPKAAYGEPNYWLTCITLDPGKFGASREEVRLALEAEEIESRPAWKPLHMQPVFAGCRARGGSVAREIFEGGLCLPSGSNLPEDAIERICAIVASQSRAKRTAVGQAGKPAAPPRPHTTNV